MSTIKTDELTSVSTNTDLTLSANGTGGVKVSDYFQLTKGSDIASATSLTLGTDGNAFDVTGTTTVTSMATQGIGSHVTLHFDGALTFTHHATDLILPGAANITTAAGDIAEMYEYASGDWRCISYTKANGASIVDAVKGSDIASATSLTLGTDGNLFDVTGTTTITSIATKGIGSYVTLHFDGALTFTHHATDLILPGGANITTAAGDIAVMYEYASADWRCVSYTKASGGHTITDIANTFTAAQSGSITALSDGANISVNLALNNHYSVTLAGNRTLDNPTNIVAGTSGSFFITQDGTGSRTLSYGSYYDFAGGTAPTLTTTAAAVDRIDYIARTTTSLHCVFTGNLS